MRREVRNLHTGAKVEKHSRIARILDELGAMILSSLPLVQSSFLPPLWRSSSRTQLRLSCASLGVHKSLIFALR